MLSGKTGQEKFHIWTGCHAPGTPILMHNGDSIKVENLLVGDRVMGPDSKPRTISKLVQGTSNMYRVTTKAHEPFVVNEFHMLSLQAINTTNIKISSNQENLEVWWQEKDLYNLPVWLHTTFPYTDSQDFEKAKKYLEEKETTNSNMIRDGDIVDIPLREYLNRKDTMDGRYLLYSKDVIFPSASTSLDPYLLGFLLGGDTNTSLQCRNNCVIEKLEAFKNNGLLMELEEEHMKKYEIIWDANEESLFQHLDRLDLINNTYIPREFLVNDKQVRMQVLAGLIDRKAVFMQKKNLYYLKNLSPQMEQDVLFPCRSLGLMAYTKVVKDSRFLYFKPTYQMGIPVLINGKVNNNSSDFATGLYEFQIEQLPESVYYGFTVDQDHLYLTEDFLVHHNCGGNGKSKIIELFELAFGDYCGKLSVTNVTQKRPASNACTHELLKNKGKRFVTLQEPDDDEQIHVGAMKELTGGDKIQTRGLFKEPIEFKPQWKIVMTSNVLPEVSSNERGTWRRIRVTEYISRFVENTELDDTIPYQFPIDYHLSAKLEEWKEAFMWILIQEYHKYQKEGKIFEPKEVTDNTKAYQEESDVFLQFMNDNITVSVQSKLTTEEVNNVFKVWFQNSGIGGKPPNKKDLHNNITQKYGPPKKNVWKGITIMDNSEDNDDEEED